MEQLAAHARSLEAHGDLHEARERWQACLPLLPENSLQASWIRNHLRELDNGKLAGSPQTASAQPGANSTPQWVKKFGPLGPIVLALFKLKSFFSFLGFFSFYWAVWGPKFGIGFVVLILIHEMGHYIDVKRRGLPADMPVFFPGLGAYVRWQAMGVSLADRAAVSLAGPLAGMLASAVCAGLWFQTGQGFWAALARAGAWLNALNLIPLWILDGNSATYAINKLERLVILGVTAALGYALGDWVFGLIAVGMGIRLFTRDNPEEGNTGITAYFLAVITALALILKYVPKHGGY